MRVVLTKKMVVGHVMRYPGEVVELPDAPGQPAAFAMENAEASAAPVDAAPDPDEASVPPALRRRKKPATRREVAA